MWAGAAGSAGHCEQHWAEVGPGQHTCELVCLFVGVLLLLSLCGWRGCLENAATLCCLACAALLVTVVARLLLLSPHTDVLPWPAVHQQHHHERHHHCGN